MKILITAGINPDLDGVSSAMGYAELLTAQGQNAVTGFEGKPQLDAEFWLKHSNSVLPEIPGDFDEVVLVDLGNRVYAPRLIQKSPELVVRVIDHRILHNTEMEFPGLRETNLRLVGACATIITEELLRYQVVPSQDTATFLHAAIYSNTLNLKAGITTENDLQAVAALENWYRMSQDLIDEMFAFRTKLSDEQLAFALKNDFDAHGESPDGRFGIGQIEALDATSLFQNQRKLIYQILLQLKTLYKLNYIFLSVPSIRQGCNYLYTIDEAAGNFLGRYLGRELDSYQDTGEPGLLLKTKKLLLRKQIKPMFQHIS